MKVLISDLLFFMFHFWTPFAQLWIGNRVFTLLRRLKCPLNLFSEQQKVSLEPLEKIIYKSFMVRKFWSAWYKTCSWPT